MILKVFAKEEDFDNDYLKEVVERVTDEGYEVEHYDMDSEEAHAQAELYNLVTSPSLIVTTNDGTEISAWRGTIPIASDVIKFMTT